MSRSIARKVKSKAGGAASEGYDGEAATPATPDKRDGARQQPPLRLLTQAEEANLKLPTLATAGDVREAVQYLKRKPSGVSVVEAMDDVKRRIFEPRKVAAYEYWGIVARQHGRLHLSPLGVEFARRLEPEAAAYRGLLRRAEPYHAALEWMARQDTDLVTHTDVAAFWRQLYGESFEQGEKTSESNVVCFFHLCQAAGLGALTIGKRGQPARLRLERGELSAYVRGEHNPAQAEAVNGDAGKETSHGVASAEPGRDAGQTRDAVAETLRVFVSAGRASERAEQVRTVFDLANYSCCLVERGRAQPGLVPDEVLRAMRRCEAAVVIITRDDYRRDGGGEFVLGQELLVQIGAAIVLYDRRVALLAEEGVVVPPDLDGLPRFAFGQEGLTWEVGIGLLTAVKDFQSRARGAA